MIRRVTVQQAADALGLTVDAIRKRVERGTIKHEKEEGKNGRVWILLPDRLADDSTFTRRRHDDDRTELVEVLRDEVAHLRRQLDQERDARTEERRRHDTLMQQLLQRVPELEAPTSPERPPDGPQDAGEGAGRATAPDEPETSSSSPWWRRWFGG